ncbi:MAG: Gfo/Idh/MocA family oxidoreductase [Candidatus Brocadiia bacterium]|nr:MAG: Gfo/Idh/MocA family oxidoreductase [Candidatus Brocadiia bacterium]
MKKKNVRCGIIGAGFSAKFHFEAVEKVHGTNIEVVGVYDKNEKACKEYASKRDIKAFDSLDAALDQVDVIHVCTPPVSHEPIAIAALERDKYAIVEKPFTGFFGDGSEDFNGENYPKEKVLTSALASIERMLAAEKKSKGRILYAENWVYAPSIQKEREIIEKTGAQVLWLYGEEAHSGSHSSFYGYWKHSGGGVMISKGCHPLTGALYLKRVEGISRNGKPIKPKTVSARIHALTRMKNFQDQGHIRANYHDIDDISLMHIVFEDGTIADIVASDIVVGGIHNWLQVTANNHRTICNINPNTSMQTYNPVDANFKDIYVVEKTETKQGWSNPSPDEDWFTGYPQEMEAFYRTIAYGDDLQGTSTLGADAISTIYSAYVSAERLGAEVPIKTY